MLDCVIQSVKKKVKSKERWISRLLQRNDLKIKLKGLPVYFNSIRSDKKDLLMAGAEEIAFAIGSFICDRLGLLRASRYCRYSSDQASTKKPASQGQAVPERFGRT